jgi:hypothetical protein
MSKKIVAPVKKTAVKAPKVKDEQSSLCESEKIWEEIRGAQVNMFCLPDQTIEKYCRFLKVEPNRCFVEPKIAAILPAMEDALRGQFNVELAGKYLIITRA